MESEEPMDVDNGEFEKFEDLLEEGEYVETNRVSRNVISLDSEIPEPIKVKTLVTGVDVFAKDAQEKLEEQGKRFGVKMNTDKEVLHDAETLYENFGIIEGTDSAQEYRLNVIHMRGIEKMTTDDIFKYFQDYAPASIELIDDLSCNVMWLDKVSAARAILGLSKKITGLIKSSKRKKNIDGKTEDDSDDDVIINGDHIKEENAVRAKDIRCPIPPGIWRKGRDFRDTRDIFLRFATVADRKPRPAEKPVLKGILTNSRKRMYREPTPPPISLATNGIAAKNPWGSLSKNWGVADFVEDDYLPKKYIDPAPRLKERLGYKSQYRYGYEYEDPGVIELSDDSVIIQDGFVDEEELDVPAEDEEESSSEEDDWCKRSKLPRMRMHADDEEAKIEKRKDKIRILANNTSRIANNNYQEYKDYDAIDDPIEFDDLRNDLRMSSGNSNDLRKRLIARRRLRTSPPPPSIPLSRPMLQPKILIAKRRLSPKPQLKIEPDIQVILTNPKALKSTYSKKNSKKKYVNDNGRPPKIIRPFKDDDEEEGEIIDDSDDESEEEYETEEEAEEEQDLEEVEESDEEEEEVEVEEEEEDEDEDEDEDENKLEDKIEIESGTETESSDSSVSEKVVQGPRGSVIKVVPRKPKLQSTVSTVWSRLNASKKSRERSTSRERHRSKKDLRQTLKKNDLRSRIGNKHTRGRSPLRIELRNDKYTGRRSESD